jgi:S-adenosylmethionine decarboxylase
MTVDREASFEGALGVQWIVDAAECNPHALRDPKAIRELLERIVEDLDLHPVGDALLHSFPGEAGITALWLLAESHLAVHTFPEMRAASFDLYCCRPRPLFDWRGALAVHIGAGRVSIRSVGRGTSA